jgi:hypothetical protein
MQKYVQLHNLPHIFDLSSDFFRKKMGTEFVEGVHYFIPPGSSKTKKAVLWDITQLEIWLKGGNSHQAQKQNNEALQLLKRIEK